MSDEPRVRQTELADADGDDADRSGARPMGHRTRPRRAAGARVEAEDRSVVAMPSWRLVVAIVGLWCAIFTVLVGFGVSGSSTGMVAESLGVADTADEVIGDAQPIRSDEWFVQSSWVISQVEQDLPVDNEAFPGGMDATVQHDLPVRSWPIVFQPQHWGFFFLDLDHAFAWRWWMPSLLAALAVSLVALTLMPRSPVAAIALGAAPIAMPFVQWWFLGITVYPIAWAGAVLLAVLACLRRAPRPVVVAACAFAGYVTVPLGMGIYAPFIIPVAYVVLAATIGLSLDAGRRAIVRLWPLAIAAVVAVGVLVTWLVTRLGTIERFLGTSYPGERLVPTGSWDLESWAALLAAPFDRTTRIVHGAPFGGNESEASTGIVVGGLLLLPLLVTTIRGWRSGARDWTAVCLAAVAVLFVVIAVVPGLDSISHVLLLDRVPDGRMRIGWMVLSLIVLMVALARPRSRSRLLDLSLVVVPFIGLTALVAASIAGSDVAAILGSRSWILASVALLGVLVLAVLRVRALAAIGLLGVAIFLTHDVNPLYRGVFDARETTLASTIEQLDADDDGVWLGLGGSVPVTVTLVETAVESYNGFQSSPSPEMWDGIDPDGEYEYRWNRLGNVSWELGEGDPRIENPAADQILVTFDPCADFAQTSVDYVVSPGLLDSACLLEVTTVDQGGQTYGIYETVAP